MATSSLKSRRLKDYRFTQEYRTRWMDNDMYLHMNNSLYYHLFDSIVNAYLITNCARDPTSSTQIGLVVHSHCDYFAPTGFPALLDLGLRVNKLGKSSVTYEIGVFERGQDEPKAVGEFIHVFVEREGMKPGKKGMEEVIRKGLEKLVVDEKSRL